MRFAFQVCGWLIGLPLELLVIAALLRGGYRRFPLLFAYTILDFLATIVEIPSNVAYYTGLPPPPFSRVLIYWINEYLLYLLIFGVVISLVYEATARLQSRRVVRTVLIGAAVLIAATSFCIHYDASAVPGSWMTSWTRDLNFSAAILDLALWTMLIASKEKDEQLLMLSGGLGILFSGSAIGHALRQLALRDHSRALSFSGAFLVMLTYLVFLYIWWRALRTAPARERPPATAIRIPHELQ